LDPNNRVRLRRVDPTLLLALAVAAALSWFPAGTASAQQQFYICPTGSDSNPGTQASPWRTLEKARDHARTINGKMTGDITVHLRGGVYGGHYGWLPGMSGVMKANSISYNRVQFSMTKLSDGAAIYTLGYQDPATNNKKPPTDTTGWSKLRGNWLHYLGHAGFYCDEGSRYWKAVGNGISGGCWILPNPGTRDIRVTDGVLGNDSPNLNDPKRNLTEANAWWQVDLGAVKEIDYVFLHCSTNTTEARELKDVWFFVSQTPFSSTDPAVTAADGRVWRHLHGGPMWPPSSAYRVNWTSVRARGRYVRIQRAGRGALVIPEVMVFEDLAKPPPTLVR